MIPALRELQMIPVKAGYPFVKGRETNFLARSIQHQGSETHFALGLLLRRRQAAGLKGKSRRFRSSRFALVAPAHSQRQAEQEASPREDHGAPALPLHRLDKARYSQSLTSLRSRRF